MDRIIVVYGAGSTGKTTVINDIYDNLIKKGATVTKSKKKVGGNPIDFEAVLSFKGKTVGKWNSTFLFYGGKSYQIAEGSISFRI